jgi:hypothetical protein
MKRWIRASLPGPACLEQKPVVFAQEARHLRRRGTSCAWTDSPPSCVVSYIGSVPTD